MTMTTTLLSVYHKAAASEAELRDNLGSPCKNATPAGTSTGTGSACNREPKPTKDEPTLIKRQRSHAPRAMLLTLRLVVWSRLTSITCRIGCEVH